MDIPKKRSPYFFSILLILLFVFLSNWFSGGDFLLRNGAVSRLDEDWTIISSDLSMDDSPVSLPLSADTPANEALILTRELHEDFNEPQTLLIRSSLQNLEIHLDRNVHFIQNFDHQERLGPPIASLWHLVEIPGDSSGKELTLFLTSPFNRMSGTANPVLYGSTGSLMMHTVYTYGPGLFPAVITLLLGLLLILLPLFIRKVHFWDISYIGYFAVFISFWLIAESRMLQFFTGNQFLLGSLAYIMLSIFPIPLLLYIQRSITQHHSKVLTGMIAAFILNLLLIMILQFMGIRSFFQTLGLTHGLIMAAILISLGILLQEVRRYKNKEALVFLRSLAVLFIFGILELGHFYFYNAQYTSRFLRIGLLLFILFQSADSINRLVGYFKKSYRAKVFEKLAYLDQLTTAPNRMAYNRDLKDFFKNPEKLDSFYIGIFDLNNLKKINDRQGHIKGDEALIIAYDILKRTFRDYGTCYRIGGDEFSCILPDLSKETLEDLKETLSEEITRESKKRSYDLSIAAGYSYYKPAEDKNLEDLIHRADQRMYQDKQEKKSIASI